MPETVTSKEIEITLGDGTVVKAPDMDAAFKVVADMKVNTANALREAKAEAERAKQEAEQLRQQNAQIQAQIPRKAEDGKFNKDEYYRLLNDDPIQAQNYLDATRFGTRDPVGYIQNLGAQVSTLNQQAVSAAFIAEHADEYPVGDAAAARAMREHTERLIAEGYPFNLRTLNMAWQDAVSEGRVKPIEKADDKPEPKAPPSLSGAGSSADVDAEVAKFENMSTNQLEAELRKRGLFK